MQNEKTCAWPHLKTIWRYLLSDHRSFLMDDTMCWLLLPHTLRVRSQASFSLLFPFSSLPASQPSLFTFLICRVLPALSGSFSLLLIQLLSPFSSHSRNCPVLCPLLFSPLCSILSLPYPAPSCFHSSSHMLLFVFFHTCLLAPLHLSSVRILTPLLSDTFLINASLIVWGFFPPSTSFPINFPAILTIPVSVLSSVLLWLLSGLQLKALPNQPGLEKWPWHGAVVDGPDGNTCMNIGTNTVAHTHTAASSQRCVSFTLAAVQLITPVYPCTVTTSRVESWCN